LKSIFYNFISNAIKYRHSARNPIIEIYTKDYPHEVCLTFKDNGMGIDLKKYMHKLFGLYQRFHLEKEGKGMGLYLCKTQIEVNIGTQFDIYLKKME
jgi:light-regulated signal transduction histidine kinase (bacteriophytochrome)